MFTVVLDDDPTGTQSATDVEVLLEWDAADITAALRASGTPGEGAVYLQTNSRALPAARAAQLAREIREQVETARRDLGAPVLVVLRGDSTLRGHVFTESDVFAGDDAPILFVPAFPAGGRTTVGTIHRAVIDGVDTPVGQTEFARDPVFGFRASDLVEWTREVGGRRAIPVPLAGLRGSGGLAVADALGRAGPRELVVPDAETDRDIELVHAGLMAAIGLGRKVVVRAAAPLAAMCAGRLSRGFLPQPVRPARPGVLVVCGSHTAAASAQLDRLAAWAGADPVIIPAEEALEDPVAAGRTAASRAGTQLAGMGFALLATARDRQPEHDTLDHGARMMSALMAAASVVTPSVGVVVSKGGITSAAVAHTCLRARAAHVRGQLAAGISVWDLRAGDAAPMQVIVPGNVGGTGTLVAVMQALGCDLPNHSGQELK